MVVLMVNSKKVSTPYRISRISSTNSKRRVRISALTPFILTLFILSAVLVSAVVSNYFRSDLSDRFNDASYNISKWGNYTIKGGGSTCINSYVGASGTETTSYVQSVSGVGGDGINHCSAIRLTYSNKSYYNSSNLFKQWDIYLNMTSSNAVDGAAASATSNIIIYNGTSEIYKSLFSSGGAEGTAYNVANKMWHLKLIGVNSNATLYNPDGSVNSSTDISSYSNWYLGWRNSAYGYNGGAGGKSGSSSTTTYNISVFETDVSAFESPPVYSSDVWETAAQTIISNAIWDNVTYNSISAVMYYGGVLYQATTVITGNTATFTVTFDTPEVNIGDSTTVFPFYFVYTTTTTGSGLATITGDTYNQNVNKITFAECNSTLTTAFINFTTKEEGTFQVLNASMQGSFVYWLGGGTTSASMSYNNLNNNQSHFNFCFNPNLPITATAVVDYWYDLVNSTYYSHRNYFLDNATLSNATTLVNLYMLTENSSTLFTFTVLDENNNPVSNAYIRVLRWDFGTNNFYDVAMVKTSPSGTGATYIRLLDAYYKYQVIIGGQIYLTTDPVVELTNSRTLRVSLLKISPYFSCGDISYSLTYINTSKSFLMTFADTSGKSAVGCLKVVDIGQDNQTYYSCVASPSGSLYYVLPQNGTYIGKAIFGLTPEAGGITCLENSIMITLGTPEKFLIIGRAGWFPALLLVGTLAFVGISSGSVVLGLLLIGAGLVVCWLLGLLNIPPAVLYSIIGLIIVIGFLSRRRYG